MTTAQTLKSKGFKVEDNGTHLVVSLNRKLYASEVKAAIDNERVYQSGNEVIVFG